MSNELVLRQKQDLTSTLEDRMKYAEQFALAGLFNDVKGAAGCFVKIQAGAELGFPAFASMNGISIIQGKCALGGGMYNALIEASPDHELEILESSAVIASGRFWKKSKRSNQWIVAGEFSYSMEDAKRAGLAGKDNWIKNPINMLIWRMISNGARIYFPALCAGIYLPDELEEQGVSNSVRVFDVQPTEAKQEDQSNPEEKPASNGIGARRKAVSLAFIGEFDERIIPQLIGRDFAPAKINKKTGQEEYTSLEMTFGHMSAADLDAVEAFMRDGTIPELELSEA